MKFAAAILGQSRLLMTAAVLLSVLGLVAWLTMPRQEDPSMERRFGLVTVAFPGADTETIERLVVDPIEEQLAEVDEIKRVSSRARSGVALLDLEFRDDTEDFDRAWDRVEDALGRARAELPDGVAEPSIDRDTIDQDSVVLAVSGSGDPLILERAAQTLKRGLLTVPQVSAVRLVGDPGDQITIEWDEATAGRLGIDAGALAAQLGARNVTPVGGTVRIGTKIASVRPATEFRTLEELRATPIVLPSGASVALGEVAKVRRGPTEPTTERTRIDGRPAVAVGVVARDGINLIDYGDAVRAKVDEVRGQIAPLTVDEVAFQPGQVERRISGLGRSLLLGIAIVALVLVLAMGFRLGMVVAAVVPLVAFASLALYAAGGGILHQISIAALVIALGMLVDNAIVVAENVQARLDAGEPSAQASLGAIRELAVPLGVATATTLAAFIPMFLAQGGTADFTRAIPIVIMLTLTMSYGFAVLVTPVLARWFLRRRVGPGSRILDRVAGALGRVAVRRHRWVLAGAALAVAGSVVAAGSVEQRFFPSSDREVVVVDLALPEGSHLGEIDAIAGALERSLADRDDTVSVATFVGRAAPHFYYNLQQRPRSPHLAQLIVSTRHADDNAAVIEWVREQTRTPLLAGVEVIARRLEQGPPIAAPVEVRLTGSDLGGLARGADLVKAELLAIPGAVDVRSDVSLGGPTVAFEIDDAAAARRGLSRADVGVALVGRTRGRTVGQFRAGDDPVPIVVRGPSGDETTLAELQTTDVGTPGGPTTPMSQLAHLEVQWRPSVIRHRNRERIVSVFAQLAPGRASSEVVRSLRERLADKELPQGVTISYGGESEGSAEANAALLRTLPLGLLVLLIFLMAEFNSFRRVAIIMATVPLALTGVIPGLLLGGQPFGFMAMLGVIALVGVVVNNAIVLLDLVERRRGQGVGIGAALADAVRSRTRPILLTTTTTVAGLLPLALSATSLWPPLAWAMITGLIASTALTLLVVPALYRALFSSRPSPGQPSSRPSSVWRRVGALWRGEKAGSGDASLAG